MPPTQVLAKSNLGQAASYVCRHRTVLCRFTENTSVPIYNNDCEQLMKRVTTGRNDWMFKGPVAAGELAANWLRIVGSIIRNELDVRAYLDDVLRRALAGETDWSTLTPQAWKAEHPDKMREYRNEQRRSAADRKRTRRARRRALNRK